MVTITARGRSMPAIIMNSRVLSSMAESEPSPLMTGYTLSSSPSSRGVDMVSSRASIRSALPRMVLISPLWASRRLGWARSQEGSVLVEKREWTMAMAEAQASSWRSG